MKYQDFEEDWTCPYCKKTLKKFIRVFEEEKHGIPKATVRVNYGIRPFENHPYFCRKRKLMELANYYVQELDGCHNCIFREQPSIHDELQDSEGFCVKFDQHIRYLGKCDEHETS
jgi:hypothetical protein